MLKRSGVYFINIILLIVLIAVIAVKIFKNSSSNTKCDYRKIVNNCYGLKERTSGKTFLLLYLYTNPDSTKEYIESVADEIRKVSAKNKKIQFLFCFKNKTSSDSIYLGIHVNIKSSDLLFNCMKIKKFGTLVLNYSTFEFVRVFDFIVNPNTICEVLNGEVSN